MRETLKISLIIVFFFTIFGVTFAAENISKEAEYPVLSITGYKRYMYYQLNVNPSRNYDLAPKLLTSTVTAGPWQEALRLYIGGRLSDDLSIVYNLSQHPTSSPYERYNVQVKYKMTSLLFGDYESRFPDHSFLFHEGANGVGGGIDFENFSISGFWGKYGRGYPGTTTTLEFSSPDYDGNKISYSYYIDNPDFEYRCVELEDDVNEGSIRVFLDEEELFAPVNYFVDYRYGTLICFKNIGGAQKAKIVYKKFDGKEIIREILVSEEAKRQAFQVTDWRIADGREIVTVDGMQLLRDIDYKMDYATSTLVLARPVHESSKIVIKASSVATSEPIPKKDVYTCGLSYMPDNASKIDSMFVFINPDMSRPWYSPTGYFIWDTFGSTRLFENTYLLGEISTSTTHPDVRAGSAEVDTALKVEGRTRWGRSFWTMGLKNVGPKFASYDRAKTGVDQQQTENYLTCNYELSDEIQLFAGGKLCYASEETQSVSGGFSTEIMDFLETELKIGTTQRKSLSTIGEEQSAGISCYLDMLDWVPRSRKLFRSSQFHLKYSKTYNNKKNRAGGTSILEEWVAAYNIGWLNRLYNDISIYLRLNKNDSIDMLNDTSTDLLQPFLRLSYLWNYGGRQTLDLYGDYEYSIQESTGSDPDYNSSSYTVGLVLNIPQDNVVLSSVRIGGFCKFLNYKDINDSANNFNATELGMEGSLIF